MIIGPQAYTIRDFCKTPEDIRASFQKLHDIGFTTVQISGIGPIDPAELKSICDEYGLQIVLTHSNPDRILNDTKRLIEEHKLYGCHLIGVGCMPQKYIGSAAGARQFLQDYTPAARLMAEQGMKLCYHNHHFEFIHDCGEVPFDILVQETDPDCWGFIPDTYWIQFAGRCPARQMEALKGRVEVCHFKDLAIVDNAQRMAPVMDGNLDWPEILAACEKAGVQHAMIEQDLCYEDDPFDCLKRSLRHLKEAF